MQVHLRPTWNSRVTHQRQWPTICLSKIQGFCLCLQLRTQNKQPVIPAEQWTGGADGPNDQEPFEEVQRPIHVIQGNTLPVCNLSPAELLMGRKVRTTLPQIKEHLVPQWQYLTQFRRRNKKFKQRQKVYYDRSHHTTQLPPLPNHTQVWVKTEDQMDEGTVNSKAETPRSYWVDTSKGNIRRNRQHLTATYTTQTRVHTNKA